MAGAPDEYVVVVDGAVATRTRSSGSMLGALDVDTVQEVQVLTGKLLGGIRPLVGGPDPLRHQERHPQFSRRPGREFPQLGARRQYLDAQSQRHRLTIASGAAPYRFNQYGFDVGGPVFIPKHFNTDRNKLFFFYAEEWIKRRYESTNTGTVPSLAMRNGDFSELLKSRQYFFRQGPHDHRPDNAARHSPATSFRQPRSAPTAWRCSTSTLARPGFQQGSSNWIGTKSTHSDLRKDTFKVDYLHQRDGASFRARNQHVPGISMRLLKTPSGAWKKSGRGPTGSERSA